MVNLDRCNESCNTLDDLPDKIYAPNKAQNVKLRMNQKLYQNTSCDCKWKFDGRKCNLKQKWSNDKWRCECKSTRNIMCEKKIYIFESLAHVLVKIINI